MMRLPGRFEHLLTGRMRVRPGWFGRLIPQVQVLVQEFDYPVPPMPSLDDEGRRAWIERERNKPPASSRTKWRDARWIDLQECGRFVVGPEAEERAS